jgi:hypothetical protein
MTNVIYTQYPFMHRLQSEMMTNEMSATRATILLITLVLTVSMITSTGLSSMYAAAQNNSGSNMSSASVTNATSSGASDLDAKMQQLTNSNDPTDIATLAYIYGFPLVAVIRTADFSTNPDTPPAPGRGPINTFNHFREFPNSNFTDIVRVNLDTLYSTAYLNMSKEPLVLKVPPITDRYFTLQFIDAYSNNFNYVGSRLNETTGGTYLVTGPNWQGTVPSGMKQIKAPTDSGLIGLRIFVNGPDDVSTVNSIQDKFSLSPLSGNTTSPATSVGVTSSNASKEIPVKFTPSAIPKTGIAIYDEIGKDLANNLPPQADSEVLAKFKTIGIGPGLTPSKSANDTVNQAFEKGITNGQQLIDEKVLNLGPVVNGWAIPGIAAGGGKVAFGDFGTDYLLRSAVAQYGLFANSPDEAVYPTAFVDSQGQNLTGMHNYVIHFDNGQTPPVKAFWSVTLYNNKSYLADNPINRYAVSEIGLKNNTDGSLDIYIQHDNPGKDKESNWLPAPAGDFNLILRQYVPEEPILNGQYQYPLIKQVS